MREKDTELLEEAYSKIIQEAQNHIQTFSGKFFDGEGHADYAKIGDEWYSINGDPNGEINKDYEIRWRVNTPQKIEFLNSKLGGGTCRVDRSWDSGFEPGRKESI